MANSEYKKMAKRLNQRMVAMEKSGNLTTEYREIQKFLRDIGAKGKGERLRFPERNPGKYGEEATKRIQEEMRKLDKSGTITKSGMGKAWKAKAKKSKSKKSKGTPAERLEKAKKKAAAKIKKIEKRGVKYKEEQTAYERYKKALEKELSRKAPRATKVEQIAGKLSDIKPAETEYEEAVRQANARLRATRKAGFDWLAVYKNTLKQVDELQGTEGARQFPAESKVSEADKDKMIDLAYQIINSDLTTKKGREANMLPEIQRRMQVYGAGMHGKMNAKALNDVAEMIYSMQYDWYQLAQYLTSQQVIELFDRAAELGISDPKRKIMFLFNAYMDNIDNEKLQRFVDEKLIERTNLYSYIRSNLANLEEGLTDESYGDEIEEELNK